MMNDTLVRSFEFHGETGIETYDVPIGRDLLRASNDLRIVPTFFYKRDGCKGNYPRMTTSLLGTSSMTWSSVDRRADSIGDFYNLASGRVVVLVGSPAMVPYAFAVLNTLGSVNTSIRELDVEPYDGSIPKGYDYAIVVAAPDLLSGASLTLTPGAANFTLADDSSGAGAYRASYGQPFGVLEVDTKGSPILYATYWKDATAASSIALIAPARLAEQADDVLMFNREQAAYSAFPGRLHAAAAGDPVRRLLIPGAIAFVVLLAGLLFLTARRARSSS